MFDGLSVPVLAIIFIAAVGVVWAAGVWLADTTDIISSRFHLGQAIGGIILLAIGTNLPELAITASAALRHNIGIAIGNLLGGIAIQTVVLVALDAAVKGKRPLTYRAASLTLVLEAALVTMVLTLSILGTRLPASLVFWRITPQNLLIVIVWLAGIWILAVAPNRMSWAVKSADVQSKPAGHSQKSKDQTAGSTGVVLGKFAIACIATLGAGIALEQSGEVLAGRVGMSGVLFGATVLAASTSNVGHNHPHVVSELVAELKRQSPAMLQSNVVEEAGALARSLCQHAGGKVSKVFFCSSGSEGVEAVIKFSRAHTGRTDIVYASGAFHGLTCGALSLMGSEFWRESFGPMLQGTHEVPFGDLKALEKLLTTKKIAAVILEPIQAEAGIVLPPKDYLADVQKLCQKYGALFVLDEVQTGMGRTGTFLAAQRYGAEPDMIVMAKALSGGFVPCAAVLMTDGIYKSVFHSLRRAFIHTSTFSENSLAMCAGLATIHVLDQERLVERANSLGEEFRDHLRGSLAGYEMVKDVRGEGMLTGIEFQAPHSLAMRVSYEAFKAVHPGLFGQVFVMRLFKEKNILTQICGNNFMVLKVAPPLSVSETQLGYCVESIRSVVETVHSSSTFWADALKLGRRAMTL